jgi:hypothetical protein
VRGVYTTVVEIASVAAAKTLLLGTAPADAAIEILSVSITNADIETSEQMIAAISRVTTLGSPSDDTTALMATAAAEAGSATSDVTWLGNLDVEPTAYNANPIRYEGFNNIGGFYFDPLPETRPIIAPSASFGVRLISTPSTAFRAIVSVTYREIG